MERERDKGGRDGVTETEVQSEKLRIKALRLILMKD